MRMGNGSTWISRMWSSENESSEMRMGNVSTWIARMWSSENVSSEMRMGNGPDFLFS